MRSASQGRENASPEMPWRHFYFVENAARDRGGLTQALLPGPDRHRTQGQQRGEEFLAGPEEFPDRPHPGR
jgi:hypothetical protein